MKFNKILQTLNSEIEKKEPIQSSYWEEWQMDFEYEKPTGVHFDFMWDSDIDEHRWYGLRDIVFGVRIDDEYIGYMKTTLITQSYSESQSLSDIYHSYPKFKQVFPHDVVTTVYKETK